MVIRLPFGESLYEVKPSKIIGLGKNYLAPNEPKENAPEEPIVFLKPPSSLIGPERTIIIPKKSKEVHHEVELGVIIGERGKNIPREGSFRLHSWLHGCSRHNCERSNSKGYKQRLALGSCQGI